MSPIHEHSARLLILLLIGIAALLVCLLVYVTVLGIKCTDLDSRVSDLKILSTAQSQRMGQHRDMTMTLDEDLRGQITRLYQRFEELHDEVSKWMPKRGPGGRFLKPVVSPPCPECEITPTVAEREAVLDELVKDGQLIHDMGYTKT